MTMPGAKQIIWSAKELQSAAKTFGKHTKAAEAIAEHNAHWKTNRTLDGLGFALSRVGKPGYGRWLRKLPRPDAPDLPKDGPDEAALLELVGWIRRGPGGRRSFRDICDRLGMAPKDAEKVVRGLMAKGHKLSMDPGGEGIASTATVPRRYEVVRLPIRPVKDYFRFGVVSDVHCGSKLHMQDELESFVKFAYKDRGVRTMFLPGDVHAGINMYPGQPNEILSCSMKDQVAMAADQLPQHEGLDYYAIGGNHDESFFKAAGADPLEALAVKRSDFHYLGFYNALIDVFGVRLELHHPQKHGTRNYALSYCMQREIDAIPGGMKPDIALWGHTHQWLHVPWYRNICGFYCGCFEGQTLFLKRMHIDPVIGGMIITVGIDSAGSLRSITPEFVHYFHGTRYIGNPKVDDAPTTKAVQIEGRQVKV